MSKKVTKQIIRNNMESYAAHVKDLTDVGGRYGFAPSGLTGIFLGSRMMAEYVMGVIDGDHAIDHDIDHLTKTIVDAAKAERDSIEEMAEKRAEEAKVTLDELLDSLSDMFKDAPEGGAGDDADAE